MLINPIVLNSMVASPYMLINANVYYMYFITFIRVLYIHQGLNWFATILLALINLKNKYLGKFVYWLRA